MRLDVYLVSARLCQSRQRGRALIENGQVTVDGKVCTKPSLDVEGREVLITGEDIPYVSRGGLKLEGALDKFKMDVTGLVCCDIGSSTGGFTHCLLLKGAEYVFAVDCGSNQPHSDLRSDPRVQVMENFNARYLSHEDLGRKCDLAVMDVSFISQSLIYGAVSSVLDEGGSFISLIKPQFEAGREALNKKGIVTDRHHHERVICSLLRTGLEYGLFMTDIEVSPITGGDGNIEYLALFKKGENTPVSESVIKKIVYRK